MRTLTIGLVLAACVASGGCGSDVVTQAGPADGPVNAPYDGPMSRPRSSADNATVPERSGAAGLALECAGEPFNGGGGDYDSGLESVAGDADGALASFLDEEAWAYQLPTSGYRLEREGDDRVLLSYDVDGATKVAFVAADGIRDYNGDTGWGVESWSACDPAELPPEVAEALGSGVWHDTDGGAVPVTRIVSFQGAQHCDWQDITFLSLRDGHEQFVRDVRGALGSAFVRGAYDDTAELPGNAEDTGLTRNGRMLWIAADRTAAYLVAAGNHNDVERWPAAREPIMCV